MCACAYHAVCLLLTGSVGLCACSTSCPASSSPSTTPTARYRQVGGDVLQYCMNIIPPQFVRSSRRTIIMGGLWIDPSNSGERTPSSVILGLPPRRRDLSGEIIQARERDKSFCGRTPSFCTRYQENRGVSRVHTAWRRTTLPPNTTKRGGRAELFCITNASGREATQPLLLINVVSSCRSRHGRQSVITATTDGCCAIVQHDG